MVTAHVQHARAASGGRLSGSWEGGMGIASILTIRLARGTEILLFPTMSLLGWSSDERVERFLSEQCPVLVGMVLCGHKGFLRAVREGMGLGHLVGHLAQGILEISEPPAIISEDGGKFFRLYFPGLGADRVEEAVRRALELVEACLTEDRGEGNDR